MTENNFRELCAKHSQSHLTAHYEKLAQDDKMLLLKSLENLDVDLVMSLYKTFSSDQSSVAAAREIKPASIVPIPGTEAEKALNKKAEQAGESLLRTGGVAVLIVAGGQGSRLGFAGPKGTYPLSPLRKKTLFQLFAEQTASLAKKYACKIPLIIMTSNENHEDTLRFFQEQNFFGLDKNTLHFFQQEMLPTITPQGQLVLKNNIELLTNPNGHGGSLKGLHDSGILDMLIAEGYKELFYCQVDNPLVKIADPVFLGYHIMNNSEVSTKVVRRTRIEEKVGVYLNINGKEGIAEYSDLDPQYMSALDGSGNILYWGGNTAIHIFSLPFVKRINDHGFALPYHCAKKKAEINGLHDTPETVDIWKFETFVFDAITLAKKTFSMEVSRDEEFSPVKNSEGTDTPETARAALVSLHRTWLAKNGVNVSPDAVIEISPLYAMDEEELGRRRAGLPDAMEKDTYLG